MKLIRKEGKSKYHIASELDDFRPTCSTMSNQFLQPDLPGMPPPQDSQICLRCRRSIVKRERKRHKKSFSASAAGYDVVVRE